MQEETANEEQAAGGTAEITSDKTTCRNYMIKDRWMAAGRRRRVADR